jgi:hypothetical protein
MATIKRVKHYVIFTVPKYPGFTVRNLKGEYCNHVHLGTLAECESVIRWVENKVIPKKAFFRESCRRLATDRKYIQRLENHKNKDYYYNPNKGVRNR